MASFTGTLDKCNACDKTVYFIDLLSADGVNYHKSCFKCSHCKGTLVMSNYSSMDGVLYCKPHFEQLFKESGNFSKNFQTTKHERDNSLSRAPSKLSAMFSGTQDKCPACEKTVYPLEKITMEGESYHKSCFKCAHGGCPLTHSSYAALDGVLYCKVHFQQLFMEKGSYQHVLTAAHKRSGSGAEMEETPEQGGELASTPRLPSGNLLEQVVRLVSEAKRPVLYVRGGCLNSGEELRRFVELNCRRISRRRRR